MLQCTKAVVVSVVCALVLKLLAVEAHATDYFVNIETGTDSAGTFGTSSDPFKTISYAMFRSISGDTIKVKGGTTTADYYTVANGESFPIYVKSGVDIDGDEASQSAWARIGGDLIDNSVDADALFIIDATAGDRNGIEIRDLKFMGEDETGVDSPVALLVAVSGGYGVNDFIIEHNICYRPYQNASGSSGLATVHLSANNGGADGDIRNNIIDASNRGGIEVAATVTSSGSAYLSGLFIDGNTVTTTSGAAASFGIAFHATDSGATTIAMNGPTSISGNTVLGRGTMTVGIEIDCAEHTTYNHLHMDENIVSGCATDGITFSADGWDASNQTRPEIAILSFDRNRVIENGGSGVVLTWDRDQDASGAGYIVFAAEGSLIADNGDYGVKIRGFGSASYGSTYSLTNCTVVYNADGGEGFTSLQLGSDETGEFDDTIWQHRNTIMYFNNSNGAQVIGLNSGPLGVVHSNVVYSDWKGLPTPLGTNLDTDPYFIDPARHDYHLDNSPLSPCVDKGSNTYVSSGTVVDIDGQDRIQDGDCTGTPAAVVDMGYDELPENCP